MAALASDADNTSAIGQLLRVLDRLDKYDAVADSPPAYDENAREKLRRKGLDLIVAEKFPDQGLGAAINDRLRRAARATPDARGTPG